MRIPKEISDPVKELVFAEADNVGYLSLSRPDSGAFMERLVANPNIGGIVAKYGPKEKVRTYIKDSILNRYSKDIASKARPRNLVPIIKRNFGFSVNLADDSNSNGISLYKSSATHSVYIIVANGTYLKWESALRKALLYSPGKPFAENKKNKSHIFLTLFCSGKKVNSADKEHLKKALKICNATVYLYGEP